MRKGRPLHESQGYREMNMQAAKSKTYRISKKKEKRALINPLSHCTEKDLSALQLSVYRGGAQARMARDSLGKFVKSADGFLSTLHHYMTIRCHASHLQRDEVSIHERLWRWYPFF